MMTGLIRKAGPIALIAFVLICLVLQSSAPAQDTGRTKLLPDVKGSDCVGCHGGSSPLPQSHPNIAGKTFRDCDTCHAPGTAQQLSGKMPLFHQHILSGLTCASCHTDPKAPELTAADVCMGCHNPEKVSTTTANMKPANPHNSRHYGKKADCNICHHQHEKSENYCSQCHSNFNFKVP
jgi:Cytochrome c3